MLQSFAQTSAYPRVSHAQNAAAMHVCCIRSAVNGSTPITRKPFPARHAVFITRIHEQMHIVAC